jgi:hypothetical protein
VGFVGVRRYNLESSPHPEPVGEHDRAVRALPLANRTCLFLRHSRSFRCAGYAFPNPQLGRDTAAEPHCLA